MDKNTIIGIVLIVGIMFGYSYLNRPTEAQLAQQQRTRDSIAMVEAQRAMIDAEKLDTAQQAVLNPDSVKAAQVSAQYAQFAGVATGASEKVTLENEHVKLLFDTEGGSFYSVELKDYTTHDSLPLLLFEGKGENIIDFTLLTSNNRVLNTASLFFTPLPVVTDTLGQRLTMRLAVDSASYIDFIYSLPKENYMVDFSVRAHNMTQHLAPQTNGLDVVWRSKIRQQEKGRKFESRYATLNYRFAGDDVEKLSESKNDSKTTTTPLQWVAFKDQFFSSVLISDDKLASARLTSVVMPDNSDYIKEYELVSNIDFDPSGVKQSDMHFFFGPNRFKVLKNCDKLAFAQGEKMQLQELIPLGWSLFRWVSQYLIIPLFNWLGGFISNYGIIILLMTVAIKLLILPLTFKSYMSTAKMRVLKPQIDAINERIPADRAMDRQQATMALYKSVGVSPMGGCLPMILQMPFLFAMFSFFPTAIELRHESFLWATDLSTYDAILSWDTYIPLITPYFGNHISLFCLLMTVTNIIYTKINMQTQPQNDQMKMMKWMMYLMPVMFLFIFNSYASGLSYYYFVSLLLTIVQTYLFRLFVNEEKLLKRLEANKLKKKPAKKKSGFMARLEEAQRQQQQMIKQQQQQNRKK